MYQKLFSTSFKKSILIVAALLLVFSIVLVSPSQVAKAATITVTSTSGGTGGPDCTLRDAITAANTDTATGGCPAGSGADTIVLGSGATYTLSEIHNPPIATDGLPAINSQITIEGNESIIERSNADGTPEFRIFYVAGDGDLTLNELTVTNGDSQYDGGGIKNWGALTINDSTISGNSDSGISTLEGSSVYIYNSTISGNSGGNADGGIRNNRGAVVIYNSSINGNHDSLNGGGIHNFLGTVDIYNSTISGNSVTEKGGGIYNRGGGLTLINSTISDNEADVNAGGVYNYPSEGGTVELENTIVATQQTGSDCAGDPVTSLGYNLDSDGSCNLTATGDLSNTNPQLGPLADNGGPSLTHALLPGSPAIDAGSCSGYTADQRDYPRPVDIVNISNADDGCDMGAYEDQNLPPTISGTLGGQNVNDNATIDPFTAVTIADPDDDALTVIVSLNNANKGELTNLGGFSEGPSGTYTFVGSPASATTAIRGLTFNPTPGRVPVGQTETTTFTITADDSFADPVTDDTTTVIVTAVGAANTPPSISGTQAGQTVDDNATIDPFSAVTIADPDTVAITVTVTLDDPAKGNLNNLGGFVEGPAGNYSFVGSQAASTTAIRGLTFDPTEDRVPVGQSETTTFTIGADDGIASPVTDDTTTVIVTVVDKTKEIFLPLCTLNFCSNFFDDFSNPASGWDVVNDDFEYTEYLNGEYRVVPRDIDYVYYYPAPTCSRQDYVVEVDIRWVSSPGGSYGILFGALGDFSRYYTFEIDTYWQEFSVWRVDPSGWTEMLPWTHSSAINTGTSSNHLKLTRDGTQITLDVNGIVLGTRSDNSLTGPTYVGVMTAPYYEQPTYDVRFDNFSVKGNK